jgi:hypothetical protein
MENSRCVKQIVEATVIGRRYDWKATPYFDSVLFTCDHWGNEHIKDIVQLAQNLSNYNTFLLTLYVDDISIKEVYR